MDQSSSSRKFTREELSTAAKDYFARNPKAHQQLLSTGKQELHDGSENNLLGELLMDIRDGDRQRVATPDGLADEDSQSGRKKEQEVIIKSKTASTPKIIEAKSKKINRV